MRLTPVFTPNSIDHAAWLVSAPSTTLSGALPPIVMIMVYIMTPEYISLLWTHPTGLLMLAGCVVWMSTGIFVMKKMINFDF